MGRRPWRDAKASLDAAPRRCQAKYRFVAAGGAWA